MIAEIFGILVLLCFLLVISSDGIDNGIRLLMCMVSMTILPMYMMVKMDSVIGLLVGLFGGLFVTLVVSEWMEDNSRSEI